jgi:uncharacterized protein YdeI (YjbR/CyaY-like superfamily)
MKNKLPAFDTYIAKKPPFARPILAKIRELVHQACPDVQEVMKWSHPHFDYKGIMAGMASFKEHVHFGFWKQNLLKDPNRIFKNGGDGHRTRITSVADLAPDRVVIATIKEAAALNAEGVKEERPKTAPKPPPKAPEYLIAALKRQKGALAKFDAFSPSAKREYIEWLVDAKQDATREKRLATAVEWIAEGKHRNWKYEKGC